MGLLAENKIRRKINKDPNNTKWTKDTNTFGQKILRAQGWEPGQYLGAKDAPHSELHTAANASYIRVILKDDMKGLGFNKSKEDEVTGLDVFQDLLSRLNGKSDDAIQEDQQARLAVKTHHFVEQRYGPMRFVYGGLLVGDEMKEKEQESAAKDTKSAGDDDEDDDVVMESAPTPKQSKKEKKSKKRKANDDDDDDEEDSSSRDSESKSKKRRKEERKSKETESSADTDEAKAKKEKKSKDKSRKKVTDEGSDEDTTPRSPEDLEEDKVKDKKSKRDKKEKKKRKKEETVSASESSSTAVTQESTLAASVPGTRATTPSAASTPRGSRNFVRSRFIAQKKQAVLDTKALNQIFMVKA
ncbi:hypothetical protein ACJZ2D_001898 [Fusarium nematophilum]